MPETGGNLSIPLRPPAIPDRKPPKSTTVKAQASVLSVLVDPDEVAWADFAILACGCLFGNQSSVQSASRQRAPASELHGQPARLRASLRDWPATVRYRRCRRVRHPFRSIAQAPERHRIVDQAGGRSDSVASWPSIERKLDFGIVLSWRCVPIRLEARTIFSCAR